MKKIIVTISVNEDVILKDSGTDYVASLDEAINCELGWLSASGMSIESWEYAK